MIATSTMSITEITDTCGHGAENCVTYSPFFEDESARREGKNHCNPGAKGGLRDLLVTTEGTEEHRGRSGRRASRPSPHDHWYSGITSKWRLCFSGWPTASPGLRRPRAHGDSNCGLLLLLCRCRCHHDRDHDGTGPAPWRRSPLPHSPLLASGCAPSRGGELRILQEDIVRRRSEYPRLPPACAPSYRTQHRRVRCRWHTPECHLWFPDG